MTLMRACVPIGAVVGTSAPMINMVIVGANSPKESAENCDNKPNPPHKQSVGPGTVAGSSSSTYVREIAQLSGNKRSLHC